MLTENKKKPIPPLSSADKDYLWHQFKCHDLIPVACSSMGSIHSARILSSRERIIVKKSDARVMYGIRHNECPLTEACILKYLTSQNDGQGHVHVVKLLAHQFERGGQLVWCVLENGGQELFEIVLRRGQLMESNARVLARQMAHGLEFIHSHGVAHMDVALENVLVSDTWHVKWCDLGMGATMDRDLSGAGYKWIKLQWRSQRQGYAPPEAMDGGLCDARAADVFAWGVCLFQMLTGAPPFLFARDSDDRFRYIRTGRLADLLKGWGHEHLSPQVLDLLYQILGKPERERPTMSEVLSHPWFSVQVPRPLVCNLGRSDRRNSIGGALEQVKPAVLVRSHSN